MDTIYDIQETEEYFKWFSNIKDLTVRARIRQRIMRLTKGNFGDYKHIQDRIYELRFTFGSGYRVYYRIDKTTIVLLLCGGDKSTQYRDIQKAISIAAEI